MPYELLFQKHPKILLADCIFRSHISFVAVLRTRVASPQGN